MSKTCQSRVLQAKTLTGKPAKAVRQKPRISKAVAECVSDHTLLKAFGFDLGKEAGEKEGEEWEIVAL